MSQLPPPSFAPRRLITTHGLSQSRRHNKPQRHRQAHRHRATALIMQKTRPRTLFLLTASGRPSEWHRVRRGPLAAVIQSWSSHRRRGRGHRLGNARTLLIAERLDHAPKTLHSPFLAGWLESDVVRRQISLAVQDPRRPQQSNYSVNVLQRRSDLSEAALRLRCLHFFQVQYSLRNLRSLHTGVFTDADTLLRLVPNERAVG